VLKERFSLEQQWWYIEFCNFVRCDSDNNNNNSNNCQHLRVDTVMDLGRVVDVVMVSLQGSLEDHLALGSTSVDSKHMYFTKEDEGILQNIEGVGCNTVNLLLFLVSDCVSSCT
jgi:hypothetical protein